MLTCQFWLGSTPLICHQPDHLETLRALLHHAYPPLAPPPPPLQVLDAQDSSWPEVYESIKAREMAVLDNLVGGAALEEHMEGFYLRTLREALLAVRPELRVDLEQALAQVVEVAVEAAEAQQDKK